MTARCTAERINELRVVRLFLESWSTLRTVSSSTDIASFNMSPPEEYELVFRLENTIR